jgi:peptidoglycan hydrolase CwlO-like protein
LALVTVAFVALAAGGGGYAQGQTEAQVQSRTAELEAAVRAETRRIGRTQQGLDSAQARLNAINSDLAEHRARQARTAKEIAAARDRMVALQNRMRRASDALADNLVTRYQNAPPDLVSVVLRARSFSDLVDSAGFTRRIVDQNARILDGARDSKVEVAREADRLVVLQKRLEKTSKIVSARAVKAATIRDALLRVQGRQLAKRAKSKKSLDDLRATIRRLQAQRARDAGSASVGVGTTTTPANAPGVIAKVIAAGNAIAGLPYIYGGGHGSFKAAGYDCSGSISYALAAGGLLDTPLDSTGFMSWGEPGPGKWITVYANAGHAYMVVSGRRFDTSALRQGGTRWTNEPRSSAGFVARHPPGL